MLRRAIKILILLVLLALLAAGGGVGWLFWRSKPMYAGHVAMPGLTASVHVYRDEHGIPHVFASNMNDAARALGYIHADERLFQMEMQRRAGAGRLSEILGADMLDVDKFTRTLGFYRLAQNSYDALSPETQKLFDAYAEGVNLWLTTHGNALPPEFVLLHLHPEPWTPADSLVWAKLMALQLSGNYKREILRAHLAEKLSPAQMQLLFPAPPGDAPVSTLPKQTQNEPPHAPQENADILDRLGAITSLGHAASNEWVIAGARTASGKPILANDPHLGLEAPILWYLARIETPGLALEGATVPGLPIVLLGQNEHIAWGFTTTGSDVEDLFIETVDPQNPEHYLAPGSSQPFEVRDESIRVKGQKDVDLKIRMTRHGPVLSDIDPDLAALAGKGKVMALAFTALAEHDTSAEALTLINRAANWQDFLNAVQLYQAPPQNIVYADRDGNIGFIAAGTVPLRKSGKAVTPVDGVSGDYDWTGTIPFERWPRLYNPPAGFIFNANNAVVPTDSADFYGADWEEPFRAERLQQFFDAIAVHSLDSSAAMQADIVSPAARQLLPYLLRQKFFDTREIEAQDMLRRWDGTMNKDRPEPLIFEAWLYELHKLMLADKTGDALKILGPFDATAMLSILSSNPGAWCGDANCDDIVKQAFAAAQVLLAERNGSDMAHWRWGDEHITQLRHQFYRHVPVLDKLTELDVPSSGDYYSLDRGGNLTPDPANPFVRTHGGGYRGLYDLSDPAKSRFMIATGESGHPFTTHYGDMVGLWNNVQSVTLTGSEDELKARGLPMLELTPAQ